MASPLSDDRGNEPVVAEPLQQTFQLRVGDCEAAKSTGTWRVRFDNIVRDAE